MISAAIGYHTIGMYVDTHLYMNKYTHTPIGVVLMLHVHLQVSIIC